MHSNKSTRRSQTANNDPIQHLLREAKKLHQAAKSDSHAQALPVLRRLISSKTLKDVSLLELHRRQDMVRRKHILHMLALEAGYADWAEYKRVIAGTSIEHMEHYAIALREVGYPNLWFSSLAEAK